MKRYSVLGDGGGGGGGGVSLMYNNNNTMITFLRGDWTIFPENCIYFL